MEKKEIKGQEFLKKLGMNLPKQPSNNPAATDEVTLYQKQLEVRRLQTELLEQDQRIKQMREPPESVLTENRALRERLEIKLDEERQERRRLEDERLQMEREDRQATAQHAQEKERQNELLKEELYKERVDSLQRVFTEKMDALQKTIMGGGNQKSFTEQFQEAQAVAAQMGFEKTSGGKDPNIELEIKKLEWQMKREDREFQRQMKKDER
ncbi:MAG: hypothetical protein Q8P12_01055, partial [bacterium]|nr:hypothetical protein [bacterium]